MNLKRNRLRNLWYAKLILFAGDFWAKRSFAPTRAFPILKSSTGRYTRISKVLLAKNVSRFLFWESEPGVCSPKYAQRRHIVTL